MNSFLKFLEILQMIPAAAFPQPSTTVSTVSSVGTNNIANVTGSVQSGPYTKAQCK